MNCETDNEKKNGEKVVLTPPGLLGEVVDKELILTDDKDDKRGTGDQVEPPGIGDEKLGGGVSTNDRKKCEFKCGGMCKTHQIIGQKIVIPSLDWKKDKSGPYKYVRS